ncbi:MAG: NUDIX hydrolase [Candidatus Woesearchaeota archaeon]
MGENNKGNTEVHNEVNREVSNEKSKEVIKGVSAIIYDDNGQFYFLILHRISSWKGWEFAKGKIEDGESEEDAIRREISEETGLNQFKIVKKMDFTRSFIHKNIPHEFSIFMVEANMNVPIHLNCKEKEHDNYLWATGKSVAGKLHWEDERKAFEIALEELKNK